MIGRGKAIDKFFVKVEWDIEQDDKIKTRIKI